jgi:Ca2+-binding RTX toxin-like protein
MQLIRMPLAERQAFMPLTYDTDFLDDGHDDIIVGTRGNDTLYGGGGDDEIWGVAGADVIDGGSGDDIIWSGTPKYDDTAADWGGDELDGGTGNDQIFGGIHDDIIEGGDGLDALYGGGGKDTIHGGDDTDWILGEEGGDELYGDGGSDQLYGGPGTDVLWGGQGSDWLDGGPHTDTLVGGSGGDVLIGGSGYDTFYYNWVDESPVDNPDVIVDFNFMEDTISIEPLQLFGPLGNYYVEGMIGNGAGYEAAKAHAESLFAGLGDGPHLAFVTDQVNGYLFGDFEPESAWFKYNTDGIIDIAIILQGLTETSDFDKVYVV